MATRVEDWLRQADKDLKHARNSVADGDYEWACFAAQQSAEKALKALYQKLAGRATGTTDVFPYTREETKRVALARRAIATGVVLSARARRGRV